MLYPGAPFPGVLFSGVLLPGVESEDGSAGCAAQAVSRKHNDKNAKIQYLFIYVPTFLP